MTLFITITVIAFVLLYFYASRKKSAAVAHPVTSKNPAQPPNSAKDLTATLKDIIGKLETNETKRTAFGDQADESIIDVTGNNYELPIDPVTPVLTKCPTEVIYWRHQYVYSYGELAGASSEQLAFYKNFKECFFSGIYYDLQGNTNYAFILLFDLLDSYPKRIAITDLERRLEILGACYPKTLSYARDLLRKIFERNGDYKNVQRIQQVQQRYYNDYAFLNSLGTKFKALMPLKAKDIELLNTINQYSNTFFDIPACGKEVVKVYLQLINLLNASYKDTNTNFQSEIAYVAGLVVKQLHYKSGTESYRYMIEQTTQNIYTYIFKLCENVVREVYGNKRKLTAENYYTDHVVKMEYENRILRQVGALLETIITDITPPDEETEIQLNAQNTSRWKPAFQRITNKISHGNPTLFMEEVLRLAQLNKRNPSIEMIFYEASKFISKTDKEAALQFYLRYIYYDLISEKFDNRQMTKTIQKSLFTKTEQLQDFEQVLSTLIKNKDLDEALRAIPRVYKPKRKKIHLDSVAIEEVQAQHSETVEVLNEFLQDEYQDELHTIQTQQINNQEIKIEIISKEASQQEPVEKPGLVSDAIHLSILTLFEKNNYSLSNGDLEEFARSHGVFKNQIIEKINEICFDCLDDVLIEEEAENYIMNEEYYNKIMVA